MHLFTSFSKTLYTLVLILFCTTTFLSQKKDSLRLIWNDISRHDTVRLQAIDKLCAKYYSNLDPDSCIYLSQLAYRLAEKSGLKKYMAKALAQQGNGHKTKGEVAKNLDCSNRALQLCKEAGFTRGEAVAYVRIANCYLAWADEENSAQYFFKGLRLFEKLNNESGAATAMSGISYLYQRAGLFDSSIAIQKRCLAIYTKTNDKPLMAHSLESQSKYYYQQHKYDESLECSEKSAALWEELGTNPWALANAYLAMSRVYQHKKDSARALSLILKADTISKKVGNRGGIMSCQMNLGIFYYNFGNLGKAITVLKPVTEYFQTKGDPLIGRHLQFLMAKFYAEQKNYKEVLNMFKLDQDYSDTSHRSSARNALAREYMRHDFEKKELAVKTKLESKLNALKTEAERKDYRMNLWLIIFLALLVVLLISAFFVYHHFRQKNIIAAQNNSLLKQQLLVSQMNPHFIFNSLNAVQNFIFRQESYRAGLYLKQFSELIRMILDFSTRDVIPLEDEISFLTNYLELQKVRFENKFEYEMRIDPDIELCSVMIPPMLAQPFIENAIEHGIFYKDGKGLLSIRISQKDNLLVYEIEDDGVGLDEAMRRKQSLKKHHRSLAIKITRERIAAMNRNDKNNLEVEILDKKKQHIEKSGVYVKFSTPFLIV